MIPRHPPRPRLTLNVAITGHRAAILPAPVLATLRPLVDEVFRSLGSSVERLHGAQGAIFDPAPAKLKLHSPLASGADQLAADSARGAGYHVRALLPFAPDDYRADFAAGHERDEYDRQLDSADEIFALPCDRDDGDAAYVLVGKAVVAAADILVAIWDGSEGNGPGGTAHVVDLALATAVPVIHIAVDRETGAVEATRLLVGGDAVEPLIEPLAGRAAYDALVRNTLAPHTAEEREQLVAFFAEREKRINPRIEYPLLLALLGIKSLSARPWRQRSIAEDLDDDRAANPEREPRLPLDLAYGWANFLAIRYAQLFRSGHVTNYVLSALAVILALGGLITPSIKIFLVFAELGVIGLLFLNTSTGKDGDWHRRWLQYRHLAESLRPLAYLKHTGMVSTPFRSDFIHGPLHREAGADWTRWYAAATWREMDSPRGIMAAGDVPRLAEAMLAEQIMPQASYHKVNAERMHQLDHRLHEVGNFLMGAVIASCVLFLIGYAPLHAWVTSLTGPFIFLTAGLPAISAAVFGMRGHGEHLLAASRSANTAIALAANAARLQDIDELEPLAAELRNSAAIMLADLNEWSVAYSERSLEIPG
ncbi:MAG: hypothetical protein ABIR77_06085 [Sphingomicrobium sp.]